MQRLRQGVGHGRVLLWGQSAAKVSVPPGAVVVRVVVGGVVVLGALQAVLQHRVRRERVGADIAIAAAFRRQRASAQVGRGEPLGGLWYRHTQAGVGPPQGAVGRLWALAPGIRSEVARTRGSHSSGASTTSSPGVVPPVLANIRRRAPRSRKPQEATSAAGAAAAAAPPAVHLGPHAKLLVQEVAQGEASVI